MYQIYQNDRALMDYGKIMNVSELRFKTDPSNLYVFIFVTLFRCFVQCLCLEKSIDFGSDLQIS